MKKISARVDRQATSLLDMTFWSNIAVILLLVVGNAVNIRRAGMEDGPIFTFASPEFILIASVALVFWLLYSCFNAMLIKRRLSQVFLTLDDAGVSGFSLSNPMAPKPGQAFSASYSEVQSVMVLEVAMTKKHIVPAIKIQTEQGEYVVPALEGLQELAEALMERIPQE